MKWVWGKDLIRLFIDEIIVKIKVYRYWEVLLYVITQIEMDFGVSGCLHEANVSSETKRTIAQRNWCLKTHCMCVCVCIPHLPANAQTFNRIQRASNDRDGTTRSQRKLDILEQLVIVFSFFRYRTTQSDHKTQVWYNEPTNVFFLVLVLSHGWVVNEWNELKPKK